MYKLGVSNFDHFVQLNDFFNRELCQKASEPLQEEREIAIVVGTDSRFTLSKKANGLCLENRPAQNPDISFFLGEEVPTLLREFVAEDFSQMGLFIFQLMMEKELNKKIKVKVHLHPLNIVRHGYFGILALGGKPVMGFLAKKGLDSFSQIKNVISHLRS